MRDGEVYISVDIEADGAIPGEFSMLSIGACVVGGSTEGFYVELQPISEKFDPAAVAVCEQGGLNRALLVTHGTPPIEAMQAFDAWVQKVRGNRKPIFVGFNATFDWMFTHYYFVRFLGRDPFGIAGLDIKAYFMGKFHCQSWRDTVKRVIKKHTGIERAHTHNALDDAVEQGAIMAKLFEMLPQVGLVRV